MEKDQPPPYPGPPPAAGIHPSYQPPLQPMGPPHPQPQTLQPQVVIQTIHAQPLGAVSSSMICPSCHAHIRTEVQTEPSTKTHIIALILCLIGCYLCCCIPYCTDSCQSQKHYCPNCHAFLGSYEN